ncbi:hypothetical protein B0H14DRAFT_2574145 [Mycena olivaceomarginata]|nr:hypothetical protein B0H14DRAFT_2574145 [Mycena olivaceomarginata]
MESSRVESNSKLSRLAKSRLDFLSRGNINHIYREVLRNVFAHTCISSMLDTLKPSAEILADPEHKHNGTMGLAALVSHSLDETAKASAYAWETLADLATARSGDPAVSPFSRSIGRAETLWTYYARPDGVPADRLGAS